MSVVLRFYIAPSWDAHEYVAYVYAPDNWDNMNEREREDFLEETSRDWMYEQIQYGARVYDSDAKKGRLSNWESGGDPDEPEEWF